MTQRLGVLLSGRGSNFVAIATAIREGNIPGAEIAVAVANREDAAGLEAAHGFGIPAVLVPSKGRRREEHDAEMVAVLRAHRVDWVCLAGYLRVLTPGFLRAFPDRVLNIHPSLLPSFPGLHAPEQAFAYGVKVAGCTVHLVDEELDHGVIVCQRSVAVEDDDTAETLAARILAEEHRAYPEGLRMMLGGAYAVRGRRLVAR